MEKIVLKNIYLLNWYGFVGVTIPVDEDLTFITGENESGKSTILDAFKYAFIGDTEFNKSSGTAKRDLKSYTRCLIDPTHKVYARPSDTYPTVITHIALEFRDNLNNRDMVLSVIIETSSNDDVSSTRYRMNDKKLDQIQFTYQNQGKEIPYNARGFCEHYRVSQMQVNEGLDDFMNAVGLRLNKNYRNDYKRKLRNMMTYKAESRIPEFMKKFVLEEKPVDFKKLKESKQNIDQLNADLENIKEELAIINQILKYYSDYDAISARLVLDDIKEYYEKILKAEHQITVNQDQIQLNEIRIHEIEGLLPELKNQYKKKNEELNSAHQQLNQVDGQKAINDEEKRKNDLQIQLDRLDQSRQRLSRFQEIVYSMLNHVSLKGKEVEFEVLSSLESRTFNDSQKRFATERLKEIIQGIVENIDMEQGRLDCQRDSCNQEIQRLEDQLKTLNKNQFKGFHTNSQLALIREINLEFDKRKIDSRAKMAFEFVSDVDSDWQNAIEAFLNVHRYAIIVEPEYYDIANQVLDKSNYRYVELVRTKALMQRRIDVFEDAVVKKLTINNDTALKYFEYWLGRIHAVELKQAGDYDNALAKEGKLSRNMAVTYLDFGRIREYCLGLHASEKTKRIVERNLEKEKAKEDDFLTKLHNNNNLRLDLSEYIRAFKEYDYSSAYKYTDTSIEIKKCETRIKELKEALKNNAEYMALSERVVFFEKQVQDLNEKINNMNNERINLQWENTSLLEKKEAGQRQISENKEKIEKLRIDYPSQVKDALKECEKYDYLTIGPSKRAEATHARDVRMKSQLESTNIPTEQNKYNMRKNPEEYLKVGIEHEAMYQRRKNQIQVDDLDKLQSKLKAQTRKYERIFKNDFCTKVYQAAQDALMDTRNINKELRNLEFSTKYQFEISMVNDGSDYARIIKYSEYLKKTASKDSFQMQLEGINGYSYDEMEEMEKEILQIINRISSKEDNDEEILRFSDYRNYLEYEITIRNEDIPNGKLSRQIGYNSGAATQIPYLLILAASLSMFYNQRENCSRLIFIDEPFEKMSDDNIKKMLDFFKQQNFQVILCAPSNKMDSIGSECNTIVPVLKICNEKMLIGKVQFYG